jgi:predicted permease
MLEQLFTVLAPIFLCVGVGFVWGRTRQPFDTKMVASLVLNISTPCLVLATLTRVELDLEAVSTIAVAAAVCILATIALGVFVVRIARLPAASFLPPMFLSNTGNLGLPLCLFAFGEFGLALGIVYFTASAIVQYTAGIGVVAGATSVRALVKMPMLWSVLAAIGLMLNDVQLPLWLANTFDLLGSLTIPIMLLALGVSIARLQLATLRRSLVLALIKLAGGLAIGLSVAAAFELDGAARGVIVVQSTMPVAVFAFLLAERYGRRPADIASLVLISTAATFIALPGILWLVL